jgi:hypothetical protein
MKALLLVCLAGCLGDTTPPQLSSFTPDDAEDLSGYGKVIVRAGVREDSGHALARLEIDGLGVEPQTSDDCGDLCTFVWNWDTSQLSVGEHELHVIVQDEGGNVADEVHDVTLDDVVTVTGMEVAGITDDVAPLEIEVYLFDDKQGLLGCAGSRQGTGPVDYANMPYTIDASLIDVRSMPMPARMLDGGLVHFEVWEDDDPPVCPVVPDPLGNDLVGTSPEHTAAEWHDLTTLSFDQVTQLRFQFDRPLTM